MRIAIMMVWLAAAGLLRAQAVLEPPLDMKWGDRPERLIGWADEHELDVRIDLPAKDPHLRVIRLSSPSGKLPGGGARSLEARYVDGRLIEITLHHGGSEEAAAEVEAAFQAERKRLAAEHGKLAANRKERSVANQFSTVTYSFHREPVRGLFLLIAFTRIEDLLRDQSEAEFSVMYRNDNLRTRIENERTAAAESR